MKVILEEYGMAILAIIVGTLLVGIVVTVINSEALRGGFEKERENNSDYSQFVDFEAVRTWHQRTVPEVFYEETKGRFFQGKEEAFLSRYVVTDMEGQAFDFLQLVSTHPYDTLMAGKFAEIQREGGESVKQWYQAGSDMILFQEAGVYSAYFKVRDREHVVRTWKIPVVVDQGW